uniref:Uncharacterized protein n=1 Tax=Anopheles minimus TaxID=112268 RepID=A0A182VXM8_9DIPT
MANSVAGQLLVYSLLLFFTVVAVFLSYAIILHVEQSQMWSTIKERGAVRTMPNGTTNYWYYICKTVLRRNKPTFFNFSVHVPIVLDKVFFQVKTYYRLNDYQAFPLSIHMEICSYFRNPSEDIFSRHLMSIMFETIPHLIYYCPHGNTTYIVSYWLEDKFFPKSMPAGDYRQDVWFLSELLHCKTVLRRNKPTFFNVSVHVPIVLNKMYFQVKTYYRLNDYQAFPVDVIVEICSYFRNPSEDIFSRHAMSVVLETIPHMVYYCPHGNTTYKAVHWLEEKFFPKSLPAGDYRMDVWFRTEQNKTFFAYQMFFSVRRMGNTTYKAVHWLEEKFFPKSLPAGDYRMDVWFRTEQNKTFFAYQMFFSVHMDKIRNMTEVLHMDRSTHIVPTQIGFKVIGKDFEIHFDRVNVTHTGDEEDPSHQPQQDYIPTLVKRKTYVWEITRRQPTANITVPVFLGKHDKQAIPPFQNAIPPPDSDAKKE